MLKFTVREQGSIAVPVSFIKKYMCNAPQGYANVYLYGLCIAQLGEQTDDFALEEELHLSTGEILSALRYWESKNLVSSKTTGKTTTYEFLTTEKPLEEGAKPTKKNINMYEYKDYNNLLSTLLNRSLSPSDLTAVYDFTEIYNLPQDVVIALIEYCVEQKGQRVGVAYLNTVAIAWAEENINTIEKAQNKIEEYRAVFGGAAKLMRIMGIYGKNPGKTERDLYNKWTQVWGFSHESIEFAMKDKEFTKEQPFKYLDAILRNLFEQGITTSRKINEYNNTYKTRINNIKEILTTLEYSTVNNIQPKYEKFYAKWLSEGYSHEIVLLACAQSVKTGSKKFETVDSILEEWHTLGISKGEDIKEYLKKQNTMDRKIKQVYDCAGVKRSILDGDRNSYIKYTEEYNMSHEVLMYAAEISSIADKPLSYMHKVLDSWSKNKVTTLDSAKKQNMSNIFSDIKKNQRAFPQREYTEEELKNRELEEYKRMEELHDL